jgi:hypothetical protein
MESSIRLSSRTDVDLSHRSLGGGLPIADSTIVARAREPVSGPQVLGVLTGLGLGVAANLAAGDVGVTSWALAFVVAAFVVLPLATLGHELGHALAVSLLAQRPSLVVVGRGPFGSRLIRPSYCSA